MSEKPIKDIVRHLPMVIPVQDISDGLVDSCLYVISVRKMTTLHPAQDDQIARNLQADKPLSHVH
jgi:hypothetical protein